MNIRPLLALVGPLLAPLAASYFRGPSLGCRAWRALRCGRSTRWIVGGAAWCAAATALLADQRPPIDYAREVRPILAEKCFYCHGQDAQQRMADLQLNTREGQLASGTIVPGRPEESELVRRIRTDDPDEQMPPPDSHRTLSAAEIATLERWVADGAEFADHWAFRTLVRPPLPSDAAGSAAPHPIDAFVRARLADVGLQPSPPADRVKLLRRVTLDLIGLPPTPAEVAAFLADDAPDAYERVVDRLLASPHYGERMALPWLDAARYADSNGFQQDGDTFQWVWRDWVVRALNANMPFDQFTLEQLAGDLLPDATHEQRIATAFLRNHMLNGEGGAIPEEQRHVILFDRVHTVATTWLGLTMACAQCHDHKYDPLTMRDYYGLMDALDNIPENGVVSGSAYRIRVAPPVLEAPDDKLRAALARREAELAERQAQLAQAPADADDERRRQLQQAVEQAQRELDRFRQEDWPRVMVMEESQPRATPLLERGNYETPGEIVEFATPACLPPLAADAPRNRLGLAQWLVDDANPLTARVVANRQWQIFFGAGLVATSEDFGVQGELPLHAELLDWLACELRDSGWNMKALHRLIVTSATYRQTSRATPELLERDPRNRWLARAARFRLPSLLLRDQALAVSGLLNPALYGKPVYPYQRANIWDSLAITKERSFDYPQSTGDDLYRRSLYTFWRRTVAPDNMFDASSRNTCQVRTAITNTPLHALVTLNDPTFAEAARTLAEAVTREAGADVRQRLQEAFQRVLCRAPHDRELDVLQRAYGAHLARYAQDTAAAEALLTIGARPRAADLPPHEHAALTAVCLTVLNLDETLTRE